MHIDDEFVGEEWLDESMMSNDEFESVNQLIKSQRIVDQSSNNELDTIKSVTTDTIEKTSKDIIRPSCAISPTNSTMSSGVSNYISTFVK